MQDFLNCLQFKKKLLQKEVIKSIFPNGNTNIIPPNHSFMIKQKSFYDGKFSLPHHHGKHEVLRKFNQPNTRNRNDKVSGQNINQPGHKHIILLTSTELTQKIISFPKHHFPVLNIHSNRREKKPTICHLLLNNQT